MTRSIFQTLPPNPGEAPPPGPTLPEDPELRALLERILSGQEPPPTMVHPPEVSRMLDQQLTLTPDLTEEAKRRLLDDWALSYHHGGQHVLTWDSPLGLAVLAVGMEEVARAQWHLSPERVFEVRGRFADPW